jgi:uncharacterized integral membrane protein
MTPKSIAIIVILFLVAIFIVQNAQVVQVNLFFWSTEASRALVLLITFVLGLIAGWISSFSFKKKREEPDKEKADSQGRIQND